jgi:iron complex outermembrane recepter protein
MFSQTLSGYIYNEDRVPVSHADIIITDTEYSTISNSEGFFIIRNLKEGKYLISVSSLGYKTKNIEQKISKYQDKETSKIIYLIFQLGQRPSP